MRHLKDRVVNTYFFQDNFYLKTYFNYFEYKIYSEDINSKILDHERIFKILFEHKKII